MLKGSSNSSQIQKTQHMISEIVRHSVLDSRIKDIALKVLDSTRITPEEGILLYSEAETSLLALLADQVRKRTVGDYVFYNRNVHIEPTNICVYDCKFCSYSHHQSKESWELTVDEMVNTVVNLGPGPPPADRPCRWLK